MLVSVTCADLDGDGNTDDLLLAHQQGEKTHLLLSDGSTFQDASILLPNLPDNGGVDYLYGPVQTQNVSVCALEGDFTGYMTLFFANGDINNPAQHQSNLILGAFPGDPFVSRHLDTGFRFDRRLDLTETIVCADLDGNGRHDAVFVANNQNRDYLWRYRPTIVGIPEGGAP